MDKLIFFLVDACRFDAAVRNFGYLEHLAESGMAARYKVRGALPSLSRPMYTTLMTGLQSSQHGVCYNVYSGTCDSPSVFSRVRECGGVTAAAAYSWFSELFFRYPFDAMNDRLQLPSEGGAIDYGIFYDMDEYPDRCVIQDGEFLRKTYSPDFLLLHTLAVDYNGHKYGGESSEYERAAWFAGELIAERIKSWLDDGYQLVVTADHGMNRHGVHGGTEDAQRITPLYIISPKVAPGVHMVNTVHEEEIAALLCRLLGIEPAEGMAVSESVEFI
ncbi:MAG: alkaline phosphatase family protein [Lachnospiraceae bacterium]|nr:alkaline phosphatase family protein [Lachnospiraceae bacterium]